MTDATIVVIVASVPPTLVALGTLIVAIRASAKVDRNTEVTNDNARKADTMIGKQIENGNKADTIINKAVEIHALADGTLTEFKQALKVANEKIEGLQAVVQEMVNSKREAKDLLDQRDAKDLAQVEAQSQREKFKIG